MELAGVELSFREELQCPICLEVFADPVILGCGHNFCRPCVRGYWQHRAPAPCCPECREPVAAGSLRPNRAVARLSEAARALADRHCEQHGLRLQLFCHTDLRLICLRCRDGPGHREHQASPAGEAVQFYKDKLQLEMASVRDRSSAFSRLLCNEHNKVSALKRSSEQLLLHIREQFAQMHGFLQEREESLSRELAEHEDHTLQQIQENLQKVQEGLDSLDGRLEELRTHQAQENDIEFLKMVSSLRPDDIQMPSEVSAELPLGVFKGPLQYKVWREMKDFIGPVPASLTLDLNSAHHKLLVSEDLTHVRLTDTRQQPPSADRFDPCVNVLAAQGFSSGKHYWEVEVGAKTAWDLGVARESVQRKGRLTLSPLDGYWTVWLRNGEEYKALDWAAVPLHPSVKPRRVGIYLDYEEGQVSFYNADDMSHLYTFKDTFTERLFPYFSPYLNCAGNAGGLTLCRMKLPLRTPPPQPQRFGGPLAVPGSRAEDGVEPVGGVDGHRAEVQLSVSVEEGEAPWLVDQVEPHHCGLLAQHQGLARRAHRPILHLTEAGQGPEADPGQSLHPSLPVGLLAEQAQLPGRVPGHLRLPVGPARGEASGCQDAGAELQPVGGTGDRMVQAVPHHADQVFRQGEPGVTEVGTPWAVQCWTSSLYRPSSSVVLVTVDSGNRLFPSLSFQMMAGSGNHPSDRHVLLSKDSTPDSEENSQFPVVTDPQDTCCPVIPNHSLLPVQLHLYLHKARDCQGHSSRTPGTEEIQRKSPLNRTQTLQDLSMALTGIWAAKSPTGAERLREGSAFGEWIAFLSPQTYALVFDPPARRKDSDGPASNVTHLYQGPLHPRDNKPTLPDLFPSLKSSNRGNIPVDLLGYHNGQCPGGAVWMLPAYRRGILSGLWDEVGVPPRMVCLTLGGGGTQPRPECDLPTTLRSITTELVWVPEKTVHWYLPASEARIPSSLTDTFPASSWSPKRQSGRGLRGSGRGWRTDSRVWGHGRGDQRELTRRLVRQTHRVHPGKLRALITAQSPAPTRTPAPITDFLIQRPAHRVFAGYVKPPEYTVMFQPLTSRLFSFCIVFNRTPRVDLNPNVSGQSCMHHGRCLTLRPPPTPVFQSHCHCRRRGEATPEPGRSDCRRGWDADVSSRRRAGKRWGAERVAGTPPAGRRRVKASGGSGRRGTSTPGRDYVLLPLSRRPDCGHGYCLPCTSSARGVRGTEPRAEVRRRPAAVEGEPAGPRGVFVSDLAHTPGSTHQLPPLVSQGAHSLPGSPLAPDTLVECLGILLNPTCQRYFMAACCAPKFFPTPYIFLETHSIPVSYTCYVFPFIPDQTFNNPSSSTLINRYILHTMVTLRETWGRLKEMQKACARAQLKQKWRIAEVERAFVTEMDQVRLCFAEMAQLLRGKAKGVADRLEEKKQNVLKRMELRLVEIQESLTHIGAEVAKAEALLQEDDNFRSLQGFSELRYPQNLRPLDDISEGLSLNLSKDLLKYSVWKELRDIFRPGSDRLTLNPATASPWLMLSVDLTSVGHGAKRRQLPDDPRRFDPSPCVLALDGFVTGRHYWEVRVGHNTSWTLGVVSESANRKGDIVLSPANGYWTLGLRDGVKYETFPTTLDELPLDLKPQVIGVYLDYEGGQVSFYNAEGMSHLHTYSDKFTQKLFPFFSPGPNVGGRDSEPLQLLRASAGVPGPAGQSDPEPGDATVGAPSSNRGDLQLDWRWTWLCFTLLVSLAAAQPGRANFTEVYLVCCAMLGFSSLCWSLLGRQRLAGISWVHCGVLGHAGLSCFLLACAGLPGICLVALSFGGLCLSLRGYVLPSWLLLSFGGSVGLLWLLDNGVWIWWVCCGVLGHASTCLSLLGCCNVSKVCWWCCGIQGYVGLCLVLLCSSPFLGIFWIASGVVGLNLTLRVSIQNPWAVAGLLAYNAVWCALVGNAELSAVALGIATVSWWQWSRPRSC
ncbi:uncharacterized protein LOC127585977 [Pristis pectinata]|uniref:uncharacterized protein LOC127585977 n=1 Tax=Pristis pectinata TaxID=685728 RepID=UPI00223DEEA9|nr:uncharacterized protein LOC127585977 [Pristis pectinata]